MAKTLFFCTLALLLSAPAPAQSTAPAQQKSLGDIARELRRQKQDEKPAAPAAADAPGGAAAASVPQPAAKTASPGPSLGDMARKLREDQQASAPAKPAEPAPPVLKRTPVRAVPEVAEFMQSVAMLVYRRDFAQLDKLADQIRSTKARFPAGGWKLYTFYLQLNNAGDPGADWQEHISFFNDWIRARPNSITPRVALAEAYLNYAWQARGDGPGDEVTEQGRKLFKERVEQAASVLEAASKLTAKCPQWYIEMQIVGRAAGLDAQALQGLFEQAIAFEPDYDYFYEEHARSLAPQWAGEEGDIEAFADAVYRNVGGPKGAVRYFRIAANLCEPCGQFHPERFSWPRLQEGFAAMEELYGMSPLRVNQFARMAVQYGDREVASIAFSRIGDNWEQSVWGTRAQFDMERTWAGLPPKPAAVAQNAFVLTPELTAQLQRLLDTATTAANESRWSDSDESLRQIIGTAKKYPGSEFWLLKAYPRLAANQQREGQPQLAQATVDEEVAVMTKMTGSKSTELATALDGKAMIEQQMQNDNGAEADLRHAIVIRQARKQPNDIPLSFEISVLAQLLDRHNRNQEAVDLLLPLVPSQTNPDPAKEGTLATPLYVLASTYQSMGRYQEAESSYVRLLRIYDATQPGNSPAFIDPLKRLASVYHAMGREADAQRIETRLHSMPR